jgi:hypothetical protein
MIKLGITTDDMMLHYWENYYFLNVSIQALPIKTKQSSERIKVCKTTNDAMVIFCYFIETHLDFLDFLLFKELVSI